MLFYVFVFILLWLGMLRHCLYVLNTDMHVYITLHSDTKFMPSLVFGVFSSNLGAEKGKKKNKTKT